MADKPVNQNFLEQLRNGTAKFELVSTPVASISNPNSQKHIPWRSIETSAVYSLLESDHHFNFGMEFNLLSLILFSFVTFALVLFIRGGGPAMKKVERYSVQKVTGDGRCLFRALVKGMALNKGIPLNSSQERDNADELRMAVKEVICDNGSERRQYEEALIAITVDESLKRYCQRIDRSDFWGGESELLVLSKLCSQPIIVYIPEHEHKRGGGGSGFIPIAEYGAEFHKGSIKGKPRKVVRLLYSGRNHYDLLI
ncbi:hypothetical protein Patl1_31714 [Pistacia atlantica]|uniref:Uncharacterized protein n=1 Tax=Pistacia atlantica TaxID=434234 RepID=A0ACC1AMW3_9ROSI|nr:hypothetical protein Patl1_31714 [Pistacia atlantica]